MIIKSIKITCECENCETIYTSTIQPYYGGPSICPLCGETEMVETKDLVTTFKREGLRKYEKTELCKK